MPMLWSPEALAGLAGTALLDKLSGDKAVPGCYVEPPCQVARLLPHTAAYACMLSCCLPVCTMWHGMTCMGSSSARHWMCYRALRIPVSVFHPFITCMPRPAAQVRERYDRAVAPFLRARPQRGLPPGEPATYAAYLWATAVVSAYSFTIGDDAFQAMVPFWDALNHVTGKANVRLHHCAKSGSLQMIATRRIEAGAQVCGSRCACM